MRRATYHVGRFAGRGRISIHALHEESDCRHKRSPCKSIFQSTLSMRRATRKWPNISISSGFQSTLSMRRATCSVSSALRTRGFQSTLSMRRATRVRGDGTAVLVISIHALHEESDFTVTWHSGTAMISIHALHEESDPTPTSNAPVSTISIHALHEESDQIPPAAMQAIGISIHALHEESDVFHLVLISGFPVFQSTLSMRRATPAPS